MVRVEDISGTLPDGATPLDDVSQLIPAYISTVAELYNAEFININEAVGKYFLKPARKRFLTMDLLHKIHKDMFAKVWEWAGRNRKTNKNIGVDWHQIDVEIKILLDDLKYWQEQNEDITEISAKLHHRLVKIHPFENGNGRWARFVLNLFLRDQGRKTVNWPEKELFVNSIFRAQYLSALKQADAQHYDELIELHEKYSEK